MVEVSARDDGIEVGEEQVVIAGFPIAVFDGNRSYDPAPDGSGFAAVEATGNARLSVVVDWKRQLRELVPGANP
jgi:hypothetical protein